MSLLFRYTSNTELQDNDAVKFASSFLGWSQVETAKESGNTRVLEINVKDYNVEENDKVYYKFVVNGEWKLSDDPALPTETDGSGITNHVYQVTKRDLAVDDKAVENQCSKALDPSTPQELRQRRPGHHRRGSADLTTSTVMVVYNKGSPYNRFLVWCYTHTLGRFVGAVRNLLGYLG